MITLKLSRLNDFDCILINNFVVHKFPKGTSEKEQLRKTEILSRLIEPLMASFTHEAVTTLKSTYLTPQTNGHVS